MRSKRVSKNGSLLLMNFINHSLMRSKEASEKLAKVTIKDEPAGFNCEICGAPMVIKMGRYGKVLRL